MSKNRPSVVTGFVVLCLVVVYLIGCSEHAQKSDPTSPLVPISSADVVNSPALSVVQKNLPPGFIDIFDVRLFPTELTEAFVQPEGRAISATHERGYLCFGQYVTNYPGNFLRAVFSVLIDNNTADNNKILILDVYNRLSNKVLAKSVIRRRDFLNANEFSLFALNFIPPVGQYELEFRIYYLGGAYVLANKIAVVNAVQVSMADIAAEFNRLAAEEIEPGETPSAPQATPVATATPAPRVTPTPQVTPTPRVTPTPVPISTNSGYCTGREILCLPEMTQAQIARYGGSMTGGAFANGQYFSTSYGAIVFPLTLDVGRRIAVEFEIEGNIANWQRGEHSGGKVALFTIDGTSSFYYAGLQRMDAAYRGGGLFRAILGDRSNILTQGAAFLITHGSLAGAYSMKNWGSEPHTFKVMFDGNRCQLHIDSYTSGLAWAPYGISGHRRVNLVIGNREPRAIGYGEGAITRFKKFKVQYQ